MKIPFQGLTIQEVEEAQKSLLIWLSEKAPEEILDLSRIERIDMCGIQLLLSLQNSLHEQGEPLLLSGLSVFLRQSIELSGCAPLLLESSHG